MWEQRNQKNGCETSSVRYNFLSSSWTSGKKGDERWRSAWWRPGRNHSSSLLRDGSSGADHSIPSSLTAFVITQMSSSSLLILHVYLKQTAARWRGQSQSPITLLRLKPPERLSSISSSLAPNEIMSLAAAEGRWSCWVKRMGECSLCGDGEARWHWALQEETAAALHSSYDQWDPVERVSSFKYLGVNSSEDLTWTTHIQTQVKKARQRLYHLRQQRKFRVSSAILKTFYSGAIESVLTQCISVWYNNATNQDCKALQRVVRLAERISGSTLPSLQGIYLKRCRSRAAKITKD